MAEFLSSDPGVLEAHPNTVYDLIANICHDGQAGSGKGTYRVHVKHKVTIMNSFDKCFITTCTSTVYTTYIFLYCCIHVRLHVQ